MIHWNADPVLVTIGFITIRWYGVLFAAAFLLGFQIMGRIYDREGRPPEELDRLFLHMLVGIVIGARLGHCLFYDPLYYLAHPADIVKIWEGGLSSHGGAVGILASLFLFTRRTGLDYLWLTDRIVIPLALGAAFVRIGNFMNSEIVGIPTGGSWGVVFERVDMLPRHPVQLYEAAAYVAVFAILLLMYGRHRDRLRDGMLTGAFLSLVFSARFVFEFFKTPQAAYETTYAISVGQLLSIPFIIAGFLLIARAGTHAGN
ncbi:MAG: prolipoprotein diacylglyceryl transferase [Deltaproteobacteria bacterium]|nr:prolipoprotein diacylglyceryl transferase [Deltaproteobacteria bacterium]